MKQAITTEVELGAAKIKLDRLLKEAEKVAPKGKWCERLGQDDIPNDIEAVNKAVQKSTTNIESLEAKRCLSEEREADINSIEVGISKLFNAEKDSTASTVSKSSKKKRKAADEPKETESEAKKQKEDTTVTGSPKKKVQALISKFYGNNTTNAT